MPWLEVVESSKQILIFGWPLEGLALILGFGSLLITLQTVKVASRSNMLKNLPILTLGLGESDSRVEVINVGNGAAIDVVVDKFYNWYSDKNFKMYGVSKMEFGRLDYLPEHSKKALKHELKGLPDPLDIMAITIFSRHTERLEFVVKFSDLSSKRYYSLVVISKGEVSIAMHPRGIGLKVVQVLVWHKIKEQYYKVIYRVIVNYKRVIDWLQGLEK